MKNQASRISALLIAGLAVAAVGCGSSTSSGTGGSKGTGGGSGSGGSSGGGNEKVLTPGDTGYVMDADTGIMGAWYIYADNLGSNGKPPGNCQMKGMHPDSDCSTIMYAATATLSEGFPQDTPGKMCIKGTAAKVINMGTSPDYSNIFGIGMGLDLNNAGMGSTKMPFDLVAKKITAFKFTLSGVPIGSGLRVEFPTTETEAAGQDSYASSKATKDGDFTVSMAPDSDTSTGPANSDLKPSFTLSPEPDFNPAHVLSIQVHVATNVTGSTDVSNLCISNLTAIVSP